MIGTRISLATALWDGARVLLAGARRRPVWWALAQEAVLDQHRKTTLGPLWMVFNYLLYVGTFVIIIGHRSGVENFPQYAATGMFVWMLLSEAMRDSISLFTKEESYIKGTTLPLSVYVFRLTAQIVIRTGYSALGWIGILVLTGFTSVASFLMALAGLIAILALLPAGILLFALMGAFFPDMKFVVQNLVRAGIFLTPVFWVASEAHGIRKILYTYDPFTYLLGVVRDPVLYGYASAHTWSITAAILVVSWLSALALLGILHRKVVFVL